MQHQFILLAFISASITNSSNGLKVIFDIGLSDMNSLREVRHLAVTAASTRLVSQSSSFSDVSGLDVIALSANGQPNSVTFTPGATKP